MSHEHKSYNGAGSTAYVGCMFIGMGLGYAFNNFLVGLFIGMGVGFIVMAALRSRR